MKKVSELGISPIPWNKVQCDVMSDGTFIIDAGHFSKEAEANATLVQAAPECYEALRMILEVLDGCGFQPIVEGDPLAVAVKCGQEAIKKATGEK